MSTTFIRYAASLLGPIVGHEHNLSTPLYWVELLGAKAAWPAFFNLIILIIPTNRLSYLLDYYYYGSSKSKWDACSPGIGTKTELVNLHTKAAVTMGIWIAIHAVLLSIVYFIREPDTFWASMLPLTVYLTEGIYNFMGWMGGVSALCIIYVLENVKVICTTHAPSPHLPHLAICTVALAFIEIEYSATMV